MSRYTKLDLFVFIIGPDDQEHNTLQHLTIVFFMRKTREI
ncbi:4584_t:CDS:2 [Rhizophagus irregularis]|nr:4584_t:CDS:2 [Rhizophagus irregularis]